MELRELRYFVAVAEELHFGRAAERLHIAQPAVSQQVARLERELGVRLFDRSSRVVRLSPAGQGLLPQARLVLAEVDRTRRLAAELAGGERGVLRLGTTENMGWRLQRVLYAFRAEQPGVTVTVTSMHTPEKLAALRDRELDVAFVRSAGPVPDIEMLGLWDEPLMVVLPARSPLAALTAVPWASLAGKPAVVIAREQNPPVYDSFIELCAKAGFEPVFGPVYRSAEEALATIAASDDLWSPFHPSHNALTDGGQLPDLAIRPFAGLQLNARCSLAWPAERPAPAVLPFVAAVRRLRHSGVLENRERTTGQRPDNA